MARRRRRPPRPGALTELAPLKILSQIVVLQTIHYVCGSALILFAALVAGRPPFSADLVLGWASLRGDTTVGWMLSVCWMADSFIGVIALLVLISRSKLIPDFAITLHVIHLVVVSLYSRSMPKNALWWALQFSSAAFMTGFGVWSCRWRELRPITFGGGGGGGAANGTVETAGTIEGEAGASTQPTEERAAGDEEQGFGRGRGRGRGRDGGGEYEMVGLNKDGEAE